MKRKEWYLVGAAVIPVLIVFVFIDPIPQWPGYHDFADDRTLFHVPNAFDVLSNAAFVIAGLYGVYSVLLRSRNKGFDIRSFHYLIFFIAILLTGFGSACYHLDPSNETLLWDRLPMALAFMSFFCSIVGVMISRRASGILFPPLILIGLGSVMYWHWTEQAGQGDLRAYGLVQYLPLLLAVIIFALYKAPEQYLKYVAVLAALYVMSKVCEAYDEELYRTLTAVSGHTLKHVFAAAGSAAIGYMQKKRI